MGSSRPLKFKLRHYQKIDTVHVKSEAIREMSVRIWQTVRRRLWGEFPHVTLIGNPFESIGRSEHLRTIWRALAAASVQAEIHDVYGHVPEQAVLAEMGHRRVDEIKRGIRIFHLT